MTLVMVVVNTVGMWLKKRQQARTGYTIRHTEDYVKPAPFELEDWTPPRGYAQVEVALPHSRAFWLTHEGQPVPGVADDGGGRLGEVGTGGSRADGTAAPDRSDGAPAGGAAEPAPVRSASSPAPSAEPSDDPAPWVIYHLHGGGYIDGFTRSYCKTAVRYSRAAGGLDVLSLDYRTAPEHVHPAALEDALDGLDWLIARGYEPGRIIVCGDSSGGGLALALCLKLRELGRPRPAALVLASPWTDLPGEGETHVSKLGVDVCFGCYDTSNVPDYSGTLAYGRGCDLHDPYLSPAYATFEDMPPMLIQTGGNETLLSDSQTVAEKTDATGGDARLIVYPEMFHVFYVLAPWLSQSRQAWREIEAFMAEVMRRRS